ncbi:MAG TPA: ABC transporter permease [Jiangellaceae bacterium]|nr:ABC transporter permease [Jiangellaceae bacterium]
MTTLVAHSSHLAVRNLRITYRQPVYLAFTLVQPMVWLLLFSQLFERVVDLPGFGDVSYVAYLAPGVIVMTAMMNAGWAGTGLIEDMDRGVMDRYLASPVRRVAIINGILTYQAAVTVVQSLIVFGVALAMGARYDSGVTGVLVVLVAATLLAVSFAALSCAAALLMRTQEALIGIFQFLAFPLLFLSSTLMAAALLPDWIGTVAKFNPVDWAVVASREALVASPDWGLVGGRIALLAALAVVMTWLSARAFRAYQRAV